MEEVSKELGVEYKVYSPPYRPQSNGRIECITRTLHNWVEKGTLHNWWRISGQQVFYPAKGKLNKNKEGRNSQPSKHQEKDNTKLCIIFLFISKVKPSAS